MTAHRVGVPGDREPEPVAEPIRAASHAFLRGATSAPEFFGAFHSALSIVSSVRPLHGLEIELLDALGAWEASGWDERIDAVDRLRLLCRAVVTG